MDESISASSRRLTTTPAAFKQAFADNLYYARGQAVQTASLSDLYVTLGYTIRDQLVDRWRRTLDRYYRANPKFVCYLSAEYLLGRQLAQNMLYTDTTELAREALADVDIDLDELVELDVEPGLGNGGLGRLAACYLESMATLDLPAIGYGIRYEYGIFRQAIVDGWQVEQPDTWLQRGNPWEFAQPDDIVDVCFGGHTEAYTDDRGRYRVRWRPDRHVIGEPYHVLVPGFGTETVNILRLWRARASEEFDFQLFNEGDYTRAVEEKTHSENLSKVLYPDDNTLAGRALRLQQQYFFVTCSLQDILRLFFVLNDDWSTFPDKVVIQLNDTHPVVAIPEMMRLLVDDYQLPWDEAWSITRRTFAYTCHTLLPEALETWPVDLFGRLLPRHLELIYEINQRFLDEVQRRHPHDADRLRRMSIIQEHPERRVRMAHLAVVGSFSVNGVAQLQTDLLREHVLPDFAEMWPERFSNKTNGVTPRRFLKLANPGLADLITGAIGEGWLRDLTRLQALEPWADDAGFRADWRGVKLRNKQQLADFIHGNLGIRVEASTLFDVLAKRLHEYKRQVLKVLHIVTLYQRLREHPDEDVVPRTFLFGAKAAPGYWMAKLIIKLINDVASVVNHDAAVRSRLKVVFVPNFNVTLAERIYPAADLSEQISMAGKEASGTGNMKFALNGALTIGTLDGANIDIRKRVGEEHFFAFGLSASEARALQQGGYDPRAYYARDERLRKAIDLIASGHFSGGDASRFRPLIDALLSRDDYLVLADYDAYLEAQAAAASTFRDADRWTHSSILNTARCGFFSSDRSIREYADDIWKVEPVPTDA